MMKTKHLLLTTVILLFTGIAGFTQEAADKSHAAKDNIPFGKKLPPPDLIKDADRVLPQMNDANINTALMQGIKHHNMDEIKKSLNDRRQEIKDKMNMQTLQPRLNSAAIHSDNASSENYNFHITKDINALAESNPSNYSDFYPQTPFAMLDHVIYFAADDGVHGTELWRSDGTAAGTFMVMDIEPGTASSGPYNITAARDKIYFSAFTVNYGLEPWVSDGTGSGTQILMDIQPGSASSSPTEFVALGKNVYFVSNVNDYLDALWQTDGTTADTKLVKSLGLDPGGFLITQLIKSNGLLFFTFLSYTTGLWELWRSDGTDGGTYHVGTNAVFYDIPMQLTDYNNKLYFSAYDNNDRRLWVSDGTDAGTVPAPGNNNIIINTYYNFGSFPILDNVLYVPGSSQITSSNGLYKYNAGDNNGLVKVKDLTTGFFTYTVDPVEMEVANNTLYFRVAFNNGNVQINELWSSKGTEVSTKIIKQYMPDETIYHLYNGNGTLYFVKNDKILGTELWKVVNTFFGTFPVPESDVFKGATGSYPNFLTAFKGKLFFSATDGQKGNELFMTTDFGFGASVVKDINTVSTSSSYAGSSTGLITSLDGNVVFSAYDKVHGYELYGSDGTAQRTVLLTDIIPGEASSYPHNFLTKNNSAYFIAGSSDTTSSIFKVSNSSGLQKVVPDYQLYSPYSIQDFKVADNNLVFYILFNFYTYTYELWRSDGTAGGSILLSSSLYYSYYLNVAGNTAFFVAGDADHGYELWKSDGSVAGTELVKDINPGINNSSPGGMFVYKNEFYFGAYDGVNPAFWKSDGTETGTIQLKNIDPFWGYNVSSTEQYFFEVSNNILYFGAINYANSKGTQLWKTDGTPKGTQVVKDITPDANSFSPYPVYFTDVNGTLFFIGNDGVNGSELWKTDGTKQGTQLVKDITPGLNGSYLSSLVSFDGKLFFAANGALWSSDGTTDGTTAVDDAGISDVYISNITVASKKLFIAGYTYKYGYELFAGTINETGKFVASKIEDASKTTLSFNAVLYPNPVVSNAALQITGNTKNISVNILDISGKKLWQSNNINATLIRLPVEKYTSGTYLVTVTNGTESKTIKLVKQ